MNKIKFEIPPEDINKTDPAEEMNRKLAEKQKAEWSGQKFEDKKYESEKQKSQKSENESAANEKVISGKIVKDDYDSFKTALAVLGPGAIIALLRTPAGKRFLVPFLRFLIIPFACILYYLFENKRELSEADRTVYNEKSVMELRKERLEKNNC